MGRDDELPVPSKPFQETEEVAEVKGEGAEDTGCGKRDCTDATD